MPWILIKRKLRRPVWNLWSEYPRYIDCYKHKAGDREAGTKGSLIDIDTSPWAPIDFKLIREDSSFCRRWCNRNITAYISMRWQNFKERAFWINCLKQFYGGNVGFKSFCIFQSILSSSILFFKCKKIHRDLPKIDLYFMSELGN